MMMEILVSVILLFVGIIILVVIHIYIVGRAFRSGYENGQIMVPGLTSNNGSKKISKEDLKNLPCFDYKVAEKGESSPVECVICLGNFNVGDKCRLLPNCNHSFHSQCIDSWLVMAPICPVCRTDINPPETSVSIAVEMELT
ncbi:hypothetical protein JCGZ_11493 [Jatropha curcas]|uniref:RING-type E3 ubiquitin transferase n=1 Tax=Jatropha curcas TaxID=180498 RepID=A0A067K4P7_JATCU|nr:hypothetical protein JCGZ_11493 [Jatropha curcas]